MKVFLLFGYSYKSARLLFLKSYIISLRNATNTQESQVVVDENTHHERRVQTNSLGKNEGYKPSDLSSS